MEKIVLLVSILLLLVGCQSKELDVASAMIEELEEEVAILKLNNDDLQLQLYNNTTQYNELEEELSVVVKNHNDIEEELFDINFFVQFLPDYLRVVFIEKKIEIFEVPKPDNSYILTNNTKILGGYDIYESELGPCEGAASWVLYEDANYIYEFNTNMGCNPDWINWTPIYINVDGSLLTIEMAIELGHITVTDLQEVRFVEKQIK